MLSTELGVNRWAVKPAPSVKDEPGDQQRPPRERKPDPDGLGEEPGDDNREQDGGIAAEYENGLAS
jgi:hypothetical protein